MQASSANIAGVIVWFEERALSDCAELVRQSAMRDGVQKTEARLRNTLIARSVGFQGGETCGS
jgi:hypothetical protein